MVKSSEKPLASETVLLTLVEPQDNNLWYQRTFVLPLFPVVVVHRAAGVLLGVPFFGYEPKKNCCLVINFTDDPGPVHAVDIGSLGYSRVRWKLEDVSVERRGDWLWFGVKRENYDLMITSPER